MSAKNQRADSQIFATPLEPDSPTRFPDATATGSQLVNQIGREIVRGVFASESRLPDESEMRERYAVSRTALREAYGKLRGKGLLTARPRVGTIVRARSDWNLLDPEVLTWHLQTMPASELATDLHALRRMLEPEASALAAEKATDQAIKKIKLAYQEMIECAEDAPRLIKADLKFHLAILEATRNPFISSFSALIHAAMSTAFEMSWRGAATGAKARRIRQHGDVMEAIASRDKDLARDKMRILLDDSIEDVRAFLDN